MIVASLRNRSLWLGGAQPNRMSSHRVRGIPLVYGAKRATNIWLHAYTVRAVYELSAPALLRFADGRAATDAPVALASYRSDAMTHRPTSEFSEQGIGISGARSGAVTRSLWGVRKRNELVACFVDNQTPNAAALLRRGGDDRRRVEAPACTPRTSRGDRFRFSSRSLRHADGR
jgi:hypothetical protein